MHAAGIVAAAGSGSRLGAVVGGRATPKALVPLGGRPLVHWSVQALLDGGVAEVVVAVPPDELAAFAAVLPDRVRLVAGGSSRTASVRAALAAVREHAEAVLVHDAARPLTPPEVVARVLAALAGGAPAVVPVLPVVDTTVSVAGDGVVTGTLPRETLRRVQTPQGFARAVLTDAYGRLSPGVELTDDAAVVRAAGVAVTTVPGDERSAKVTVAHDLALAELTVGATGERAPHGDAGSGQAVGIAASASEREAERPRERPVSRAGEPTEPGVEPWAPATR
ncbi:2-C-methyl-D-erythritol 4-phosphate cytidylyltransferase [Geodermatophilus sp. DSM 44513]|uniref:2-C-methyl-D-erythritol 4-phosphate cytidylyltransferase n=1 Tax=Geodermatophilus sp. DSM 44513 TaxID=1528104 RepID=UPI001271DFC6|nr:2-C-methyl-D-erythritol 4-phosphate cytidylyltransferase [Geodermatophilus sp. DSM 44513]WNV76270.1 2-C-methyl-D-erythritol 4-phosphate cytidylyltransferase [Geodermatophilus sp. DSM 44513]